MKQVLALIERIAPGASAAFCVRRIEREDGCDVWELGPGEDGRILLSGSDPLCAAAAFGHYLKYDLGCSVSWCGSNLRLPDPLPAPAPLRRVIRQKYRVYMNYCTHSYSAAWWDWARWEREIDMMALSGINMPLAVTGTESVWYETLLETGFSDVEARDFLCGPGFFAWQWMTNLEHHGGPLPASFLKKNLDLARKILRRELELGMQPIQQGFSGFVPLRLQEKFPEARIQIKKTWNNIGSTAQLDPTDPLFRTLGLRFLETQKRLLGAYGRYAADPFHEGHPPVDGAEYLQQVGESIASLYEAFDPDYTWVMQAWSIRKDIATAVPKDRLLILDLTGDYVSRREGYWGYPFVVGTLHNFGARMSLHGDLRRQAENKFASVRRTYPNACGTGLFMEGIGQNPVFYDLALEMLTREDEADPEAFLRSYCRRRYGVESPQAEAAMRLLYENVYTRNTDFTERGSVVCTRPALTIIGTGPCDTLNIHYDPGVLPRALELLRAVPGDAEGLRFDRMDLCRQMLSNYAQRLYFAWKADYLAGDAAAFEEKKAAFLTLLADFDRLLALRKEWRLQTWIESARALGDTEEEKDLYEYNARAQITIWGNEENSLLFDYAWKEWSGLVGTYYLGRWRIFLDMLSRRLEAGDPYRDDGLPMFEDRIIWRASPFYSDLADWENRWVNDVTPIPVPEVTEALVSELTEKYSALVLA